MGWVNGQANVLLLVTEGIGILWSSEEVACV